MANFFSHSKVLQHLNLPNINPIAFHIAGFPVHWYGLGYLFGILLAYLYCCLMIKKTRLWQRHNPPITIDHLQDFMFWATIGIILGGRLGDVLLWEPSYYFSHPFEIYAVWHGGMAFHGGFIGLLLACYLFAKKNKINIYSLFDLVGASAPIGIFLVRICNFINGELWGKITSMPWGVIFPLAGPLPRHPSQIYEAICEGLIIFIILAVAIYKKNALRRPAMVSGLFCLCYSLARMSCEFFREKDAAPDWFESLFHNSIFSYGMFLCLPIIILALCLIFHSLKSAKQPICDKS